MTASSSASLRATVVGDGHQPGRERELVARAQRGERTALQELYRLHVDAVYRRLTHLLGSDPEREDLLPQIFSEAFVGISRFRGESRFSTYLYRIASNVSVDHLNRRKRAPGSGREELIERMASRQPTPEAVTIARAEVERVRHHLGRIKPKKRIAFLLRVVEDLSVEEIAEQVGARPDAVAKRIAHAQRELLVMLERERRRG